jgi:hypothetical protein
LRFRRPHGSGIQVFLHVIVHMAKNMCQRRNAVIAHSPAQQTDDEGGPLGVDERPHTSRISGSGDGFHPGAKFFQFLLGHMLDGHDFPVKQHKAVPEAEHNIPAVHGGNTDFHGHPLILLPPSVARRALVRRLPGSQKNVLQVR